MQDGICHLYDCMQVSVHVCINAQRGYSVLIWGLITAHTSLILELLHVLICMLNAIPVVKINEL